MCCGVTKCPRRNIPASNSLGVEVYHSLIPELSTVPVYINVIILCIIMYFTGKRKSKQTPKSQCIITSKTLLATHR